MPDYNIPLSTTQGAADKLDTRAPLNPTGTELPLQVKKFENIDPIKEAAKAYSLMDNIGQFQENQAIRQDEQMIRETKSRDQAILKAYQAGGNGLHSEQDLNLALNQLSTKLSPDTVENLQKRRDAAKQYELQVGEFLLKLSADHLTVVDKQYESSLQFMSETKAAYDQALAKGEPPQQALKEFESAKQAKLQMMSQLKIPGTDQAQYPPEVLQKFSAMNPDQLKNAIDSAKYNRELLKDQLHNKLTQAQTESAEALAGQRKETTSEMPEKLKALEAKIAAANGTGISQEDAITLAEMVRKDSPGASSLLSRLPKGDKEAVIRMVTQLNKGQGVSASDAAVNIVGEKSDAISLNKATTKLDALGSIMKSFHNNIKTWDSIAQGKPPEIGGERLKELGDQLKAIDFTDSTSVNNWKNSLDKQFNDPTTVAYLTSAFTVAMDYARILSSQGQSAAQVSDSARQESMHIISAGYNNDARKALIGTLESDAQGQVKGLEDQVKTIKERMGGGKPTTPAEAEFNKQAPSNGKSSDSDSVQILKQELGDEQQKLTTAKTPEEKTSHEKNIAALQKAIDAKVGAAAPTKSNVVSWGDLK